MQLSITVKVWSAGVNDPPATSPVNTMNPWLSPVLPYHATGKAPDPAGGASDTVITGAFDPWAPAVEVMVT